MARAWRARSCSRWSQSCRVRPRWRRSPCGRSRHHPLVIPANKDAVVELTVTNLGDPAGCGDRVRRGFDPGSLRAQGSEAGLRSVRQALEDGAEWRHRVVAGRRIPSGTGRRRARRRGDRGVQGQGQGGIRRGVRVDRAGVEQSQLRWRLVRVRAPGDRGRAEPDAPAGTDANTDTGTNAAQADASADAHTDADANPDPGAIAIPTSTPRPAATPTPSPRPARRRPTPEAAASATGHHSDPAAIAVASPTPDASPTPVATPRAEATPTPTPEPGSAVPPEGSCAARCSHGRRSGRRRIGKPAPDGS